jgi:hypothetical protein
MDASASTVPEAFRAVNAAAATPSQPVAAALRYGVGMIVSLLLVVLVSGSTAPAASSPSTSAIVAAGESSAWRYVDDGAAAPAGWQAPGFDDVGGRAARRHSVSASRASPPPSVRDRTPNIGR